MLLEKFKKAIDKGNQFGALLTDLSKAFDCIDHKLLIAKLSEYGVLSSALNVISSYLKHRTQRTKINDCFSTRSNIEYGVPQGSILGPLLFNINMIDLFYECEENDIANYADDTTPYSCGTDIPTVISELQDISAKVFNWFGNNHMKANPGKCHLLLSTKSPEVVSIDGIQITSSTAETVLGITIDSQRNFENHLSAICNKVSRKKNNALRRIANYMPIEKRHIMMKIFIESQFTFCP